MSHALLSASAADKWLHCTPSARMEAVLPDTAGESAQEGSLAHELAELKARRHFHAMDKGAFTRKFNKIKSNELYIVDMDHDTDTYVEVRALQICSKPGFFYLTVSVQYRRWGGGDYRPNQNRATYYYKTLAFTFWTH